MMVQCNNVESNVDSTIISKSNPTDYGLSVDQVYQNGKLIEIGTKREGVKHGVWYEFYSNGNLKWSGLYSNGQPRNSNCPNECNFYFLFNNEPISSMTVGKTYNLTFNNCGIHPSLIGFKIPENGSSPNIDVTVPDGIRSEFEYSLTPTEEGVVDITFWYNCSKPNHDRIKHESIQRIVIAR